jgi:hypothetical protein
MAALYASLWCWNHLRWPDEEEKLAGYDRANPHLVLGRDDDDNVLIFRNVGALGDFLEWFGINDMLVLWPQYQSGQIEFRDIATEMAKAPINKAVQGLRPEIDVGVTAITGKSLFPDAFNPRTAERELALPSAFGLQDEYNILTGRPKRPGYWKRSVIGLVNYKQAALTDIYDLREKFQKKKGKDVFTGWKITEWTHVRRAAAYNDRDGFDRALEQYYKSGKTQKNLAQSIARMDPLTGVAKKHRKEFIEEFLSGVQRQKLEIARRHAQDIGDRILSWSKGSQQLKIRSQAQSQKNLWY